MAVCARCTCRRETTVHQCVILWWYLASLSSASVATSTPASGAAPSDGPLVSSHTEQDSTTMATTAFESKETLSSTAESEIEKYLTDTLTITVPVESSPPHESFLQSRNSSDPETLPQNSTTTFERNITLPSSDIAECLVKGARLYYSTTSISIAYERPENQAGTSNATDEVYESCWIFVTAPQGLLWHVRYEEIDIECDVENVLFIYDGPRDAYYRIVALEGCEDTHDFITTGNEVYMLFRLDNPVQRFAVKVHFTAVPVSFRPVLEEFYYSEKEGYIQTPRWEQGVKYPALMDSRVTLLPPSGHVTFLSFRQLYVEKPCNYDSLSLFLGGDTSAHMLWRVCGDVPPPPQVHATSQLTVYFTSDVNIQFGGFRLFFSYHEPSSQPRQVSPGGLWNCSVPHWPQFQRHLRCNLATECVRGEDEEDCVYSRCGPGTISAGRRVASMAYRGGRHERGRSGNLQLEESNRYLKALYSGGCPARRLACYGDRCYMLVDPGGNVTWNEAFIGCVTQGARLASLNTEREWRDVTHILSMGRMSRRMYIGLKSPSSSLPHMYKKMWQWVDNSIAYYTRHLAEGVMHPACGAFPEGNVTLAELGECNRATTAHYLCELPPPSHGHPTEEQTTTSNHLQLSRPANQTFPSIFHATCPKGHVTHNFLACDVTSACWAENYASSSDTWEAAGRDSCDAPLTSLPPSYACGGGRERVPYSLVCDHRDDCPDGSDEQFCVFPQCSGSSQLQCNNQQCVSPSQRCDGMTQCTDSSDEEECAAMIHEQVMGLPPPALITLDGRGGLTVLDLNQSLVNTTTDLCPDTHFQCRDGGYCLPVHVRCNGVYDCPAREDEEDCERYDCPGFYRCRGSSVCVHTNDVCDGTYHCPQQDDELFCGQQCPANCTCYGLAATCPVPFPAPSFPFLRYLDAGGSRMTQVHLHFNTMLVHLSLARCGLVHVWNLTFPNMRSLDLSDNLITDVSVDQLRSMPSLQVLVLSGNPLKTLFSQDTLSSRSFQPLLKLDLSRIALRSLSSAIFPPFPCLQFLNLSQSGLQETVSFKTLTKLRVLDLRGCPATYFPRDVFEGLDKLSSVLADNYKLCCPTTLPDNFAMSGCQAPFNEISSCEALLRSDIYRVLLSVFAALSLMGNLGSFVARVFIHKRENSSGFGVFVTHLCVADFFMGVYLAIVGVADRLYLGSYLWEDTTWRHSVACKTAGFLSLLSSEVSALIICLITLDRFLVLRFPFSVLRFNKVAAHGACGGVWIVGLLLAAVPLLPWASHWDFYSQTGICIPLPVTRNVDFPGHYYAFVVMIVINFVLFLLIAAGQAFIYASIRANSMSDSESTKKSQEFRIAQRLITVAMSDFLCWFPIGLLGLLASTGTAIPGEVNVAMAIVALPVNSALNPFLYTLNKVLEHRQRVQEEKLRKLWTSQMTSKARETDVIRVSKG